VVYLALSELVMLFICGGGKIGLIGEEEGDATEEIYLRGRKRYLIPSITEVIHGDGSPSFPL
jgi:hypothetical protein